MQISNRTLLVPMSEKSVDKLIAESNGKISSNPDGTRTAEIDAGPPSEKCLVAESQTWKTTDKITSDVKAQKLLKTDATRAYFMQNVVKDASLNKPDHKLSLQFDDKNRIIGTMSTQVISDSVFINTLGGIGGGKAMMASAVCA